MIFSRQPKRVFVTGGAGFIGSHAVDLLMAADHSVTVFDNLSGATTAWLEPYLDAPNFRLVVADLTNRDALAATLPGHDLVWHLGAASDPLGGVDDAECDLHRSALATHNLLDAMRRCRVSELLFASSAAVYGNTMQIPTPETAGPLLPISLHGAGKLAAEAFISAYCHLFGLRAWIFRLGTVVGGRVRRGQLYDFIRQLRATPGRLEILGDGKQRHNYLLVEECVAGMLYAYEHAPLDERQPCAIFNLGAAQSAGVMTAADAVLRELGQRDAAITMTGGAQAWPGEQQRVHLDVGKLAELGWSAQHSSTQAVRRATRRIIGELEDQRAQRPASAPVTAEVY